MLEPSAVIKAVREIKDDVINFLRDIIRIPSMSCEEERVAERILEEMDKVGFDTSFIDKIGNVIGIIGDGERVILYGSHIDTVGIGSMNAWEFEPFEGKIENDKIFGRGASDNKSAIACMIYAIHILKKLNIDLDMKVCVVGTVQEEKCEGVALKHLVEFEKVKPDCVLLGECTNLGINRGHRGRMEISVKTTGRACHASSPNRGENAIYKMAPIIKEIERMNDSLPSHEFLGKGTVAVTDIECESASLNAIPDECTIYIDRRIIPGEDKEKILNELMNIASRYNGKVEICKYESRSYTGYEVKEEKYFPAWILDENHPLVKWGVDTYRILFNSEPKIGKWEFSTDGVYSMGIANIPTIGFGPGEEKYAHTTHDQVRIEQLISSCMFYSYFPICMKRWENG